MNVSPFSRGTKRPWASIGLAGFRCLDGPRRRGPPLRHSPAAGRKQNAERPKQGFVRLTIGEAEREESCAPFVC